MKALRAVAASCFAFWFIGVAGCNDECGGCGLTPNPEAQDNCGRCREINEARRTYDCDAIDHGRQPAPTPTPTPHDASNSGDDAAGDQDASGADLDAAADAGADAAPEPEPDPAAPPAAPEVP